MGLKFTRQILSVIFSLILALSVFLSAFALLYANTYGNNSFYSRNWYSEEIKNSCEDQLQAKFEALSIKSGIPLDVFNAIKRDSDVENTLKTACSNIFNNYDSSLYSDDRIDYFYDACVLYLDANDYNYSKKEVRNIAEEATRIYDDTMGIHNAQTVRFFAEEAREKGNLAFAFCAVAGLVAMFSITIIHRGRERGFMYFGASFFTAGFAGILVSLVSVNFGSFADFAYFPAVYNSVFANLLKAFMRYFSMISFGFMALGIFALVVSNVYVLRHERKKLSGYYSTFGKF